MAEFFFRLAMALLIAVGCIVLGYCLRAMENREQQSDSNDELYRPTPPVESGAVRRQEELIARLRGEKEGLIDGLIRAYDLSESIDEARMHIWRELDCVGVKYFQPVENDVVDPSKHVQVGTTATDRSSLVGRVATTPRLGWRDQHGVLRQADVTVWVADSPYSERWDS
ncbi:hypothetical protein ACQPW1_24515 [Nocardia sp. CA-128927]|uniref:hypothetical protein n=1 Tax=Nocardia sp. CA-128927 TaxID=3239975 RepID=UPI003D95EEDD